MQIVKANPEHKQEKLVKLADLANGDVFRFPEFTFEETLSQKDEATFFMKIPSSKNEAPERVTMLSLDGKLILVRDADRSVIKHEVTVAVKANI